jgi:hypothetical protein
MSNPAASSPKDTLNFARANISHTSDTVLIEWKITLNDTSHFKSFGFSDISITLDLCLIPNCLVCGYSSCTTCKGDLIPPLCTCPTDTLPIPDTTICEPCVPPCYECINTNDTCVSCLGLNRDLSNGCLCKTSYYEVVSPDCTRCDY